MREKGRDVWRLLAVWPWEKNPADITNFGLIFKRLFLDSSSLSHLYLALNLWSFLKSKKPCWDQRLFQRCRSRFSKRHKIYGFHLMLRMLFLSLAGEVKDGWEKHCLLSRLWVLMSWVPAHGNRPDITVGYLSPAATFCGLKTYWQRKRKMNA